MHGKPGVWLVSTQSLLCLRTSIKHHLDPLATSQLLHTLHHVFLGVQHHLGW
jgi:hypothetical protein